MGTGYNGQLTFIDLINILSFLIGLQNLDLNVTQNDLETQTKQLNSRVDDQVNKALTEIHSHLEQQDTKIERILSLLQGGRHGDLQGL